MAPRSPDRNQISGAHLACKCLGFVLAWASDHMLGWKRLVAPIIRLQFTALPFLLVGLRQSEGTVRGHRQKKYSCQLAELLPRPHHDRWQSPTTMSRFQPSIWQPEAKFGQTQLVGDGLSSYADHAATRATVSEVNVCNIIVGLAPGGTRLSRSLRLILVILSR
jgi:hypothetical protein